MTSSGEPIVAASRISPPRTGRLRLFWNRLRAVLFQLDLVGPPRVEESGWDMRDDLQVVWRNPAPPPRQKAQVSKGEAGDRLAIYPSGRQVWFEDVSGGLALTDARTTPRILPDEQHDGPDPGGS